MKKAYGKPRVRRVKLTPSEAVLRACKTFMITGPEMTSCKMVAGGQCSEIGS